MNIILEIIFKIQEMIAGRPSSITQEHIEITNDYINSCEDEVVQMKKWESTTQFGWSETWDNITYANIPTYWELMLKFFEKWIDIDEKTLHNWKNKWAKLLKEDRDFTESELLFVRFFQSLTKLKKKQETMLLKWGLSNTYNPTIAKLILSSNHWYAETQKIESEEKITLNINEAQKKKLAERLLAKLRG